VAAAAILQQQSPPEKEPGAAKELVGESDTVAAAVSVPEARN